MKSGYFSTTLDILIRVVCNLLIAASLAPAMLGAEQDDGDVVTQVFVIRRPLEGQPLGSIRSFAHSGLLLQTKDGDQYVLEFMSDSRAHLTAGTQRLLEADSRKKVARIQMIGAFEDETVEFLWERQLAGNALPGKWTPQELQKKMQSLMKSYDVWEAEHCHTAQERLRREIGLLK